jgi:hypothetical protein
MPEPISQALAHVVWIGGSPCAGKSSIADALAARHGLRLYRCDDAYDRHLRRADPARHPLMIWTRGASWDEIWGRPVAHQVREEFQFYHEEFDMIVDDLLAMPADRPILAEGAALLPECVRPFLARPRQAVWIVPTEAFQRAHYPARGVWVEEVLRQCRAPAAAFERWMARDARFARLVARQAARNDMPVIRVDGGLPIDQMTEVVERHLGLDG